jgi:Fe2+ or Zn2+ uptake regulation protein
MTETTAARLTAAGERVTRQRLIVADVLADAGRQLTAGELYERVYAYIACQPEHHHHLSCTSCGRVEEIPESWVQPIADRASRRLDFEIDDGRLDFYGRCAACRARP